MTPATKRAQALTPVASRQTFLQAQADFVATLRRAGIAIARIDLILTVKLKADIDQFDFLTPHQRTVTKEAVDVFYAAMQTKQNIQKGGIINVYA